MRKFNIYLSLSVLVLIAASSCKVGKNYQSPEMAIASDSTFTDNTSVADSTTIADINWREVFQDPNLVGLIDSALKNNFDLMISYERINESRAYFKNAKSGHLPSITYNGSASGQLLSKNQLFGGNFADQDDFDPNFSQYQLGIGLSYEIDFWGKTRRKKEAAIAKMMQSEANANTVKAALIGDIAMHYFNIASIKQKIWITQENIERRQSTYDLIALKNKQGVESGLALEQIKAELYNARTLLPQYELELHIAQNSLNLLLGRYAGDIETIDNLDDFKTMENLPTGYPAQLLQNRPDIIAAEMELISENANIGVAKAAYYPSITLNANVGYGAADLSKFFDPLSLLGDVTAGIVGPIFKAGQNKARLMISESKHQQAYLNYQKVVATAFTEVSNSLVSFEKLEAMRTEKAIELESKQKAVEYSDDLFGKGVISYLDVIEAQRYVLLAEYELVDIKKEEIISLIELYKALGGGWK